MQRPCSVFATFETEEGYERATRYNAWVDPTTQENIRQPGGPDDYTHYEKILGEPVELEEASEPSDIIWENRQFTPAERTRKRIIVYTIIVIMLCMSGAIIYVCTITSTKLKMRYPLVDCEVIAEEYGNDTSNEDWRDLSAKEYQFNTWRANTEGQNTEYTGEMQCLCEQIKTLESPQAAYNLILPISVLDKETGEI